MAVRTLIVIFAALLVAPLAQAEPEDVLLERAEFVFDFLPFLDSPFQREGDGGAGPSASAAGVTVRTAPVVAFLEEFAPAPLVTYHDAQGCAVKGPLELRLTYLPLECPLDALYLDGALGVPVLPRGETSPPGEDAKAMSASGATLVPTSTPSAPAALALAGVALVTVAGAGAAMPASSLLWERLRKLLLGVALYTRISREKLLTHDSREALLEALRAHPGTAISDLSRTTEIPRNTVTHHLHMLEKQGIVTSVKKGRLRLYFPAGSAMEKRKADALAALRHETTTALARHIGGTPGVDQAGLCRSLGLKPSLAHWHMGRLVEHSIVTQVRDGRHVRYYPGDSFHLVMSEGVRAPGV